MNENYAKLINEVLPDSKIKEIAKKINLDSNVVEICSAEIIARIFGNGEDLKKDVILSNINKVTDGASIKDIIVKIKTKHNIEASDSAKVLQQILPFVKNKVNSLDQSYFVQPVQEKKEASVEDVFKNIEKKAELQEAKDKKITKRPLFKKKEKVKKEVNNEVLIEDGKTTLLEKICMWAVLAGLVGLIATVIVLTVIAKTSV